jgi:hypothetical protein
VKILTNNDGLKKADSENMVAGKAHQSSRFNANRRNAVQPGGFARCYSCFVNYLRSNPRTKGTLKEYKALRNQIRESLIIV